LLLGVPNKVIARRLNMAEGTVKTHLHGIYQLLRVNSRAQAILRSREVGLV
jgi:DNA-binding NarL/FixJ family response regulator